MGKGRGAGCHAACGAGDKAPSLPDEFGPVPAENNPLERMRRAVEDRRARIARVRGDTGNERSVGDRLGTPWRKLCRQPQGIPDGMDWLSLADCACLPD